MIMGLRVLLLKRLFLLPEGSPGSRSEKIFSFHSLEITAMLMTAFMWWNSIILKTTRNK